MARPSDYTLDLATTICARLAEGESLKAICGEEGMPNVATVYRWLQVHEEFRDMYARAREDQADTLADEILKIADEEPDFCVDQEGRTFAVDGTAVQLQKLRIDARKWIASKLKPRKYGDKLDLAHSGGDKPVETKVTVEFVRPVPST